MNMLECVSRYLKALCILEQYTEEVETKITMLSQFLSTLTMLKMETEGTRAQAKCGKYTICWPALGNVMCCACSVDNATSD